LELFFRFNHFIALERAEQIPSLDQISKGGIRNLDMSPNKLFIDDAYIDEDFDSDEYRQVDQPHNHGSL
jgi:hypothetical protein